MGVPGNVFGGYLLGPFDDVILILFPVNVVIIFPTAEGVAGTVASVLVVAVAEGFRVANLVKTGVIALFGPMDVHDSPLVVVAVEYAPIGRMLGIRHVKAMPV